jgi:hypothetical protein
MLPTVELIQRQLQISECLSGIGGKILTRKIEVPEEKPLPVPFCSPQAPYVFGLVLIPGLLAERSACNLLSRCIDDIAQSNSVRNQSGQVERQKTARFNDDNGRQDELGKEAGPLCSRSITLNSTLQVFLTYPSCLIYLLPCATRQVPF